MKLKAEVYDALCQMKQFSINSIEADYEDFGSKDDHAPDDAEEYGCGDMRFELIEPTEQVLKKYKITEKEYYKVCSVLKKKLSFGGCGWCV